MSPFFWHEIMNKSNSLGFPDNMGFYCLGYHGVSSICSSENISLFVNKLRCKAWKSTVTGRIQMLEARREDLLNGPFEVFPLSVFCLSLSTVPSRAQWLHSSWLSTLLQTNENGGYSDVFL